MISQLFTRKLVDHIMKPLEALSDGAERIRKHDLTRDVEYSGDMEFENVCNTFNEMRRAILAEQEKNRKYEKARTNMIAGISHDLRTPLTAVRGTIKGLLDGVASTPERQKKFLDTACRRTGDMDLLLNQLFYLSKLEILLENSRRYGSVTPLKIKISLKRNKRGFCSCFSDNGVGVPEEKIPYIFDEFYRIDESRNKKEGNGLGLYIVRYLTEAMGGSVRAENTGGLAVCLELKEGE